MKKRVVICTASAVLLTASFFCLSVFFQSLSAPVDRSLSPTFSYLVQEYDGKVGIFRHGESKPFQVVELDTELLPAYDQTVLQNGIPIKNEQELQQILEDYTS